MNHIGADQSWPFAAGGESNLAVATAIWAVTWMLNRVWPSAATKVLLVLVSGLYGLVLYFFRDPNRITLSQPGLVVSPGDGEVVNIVREQEERFLGKETVRISIFLSVFDVHVQRIPIDGQIRHIEHHAGKFLQAYRPEASEVNEYIAMVVESAGGPVLVKQIAGIMARRCVNYVKVGDDVRSGDRFGLIRFGSRVDLFLPPDAILLVSIGDKVQGGVTPIAQLQNIGATS